MRVSQLPPVKALLVTLGRSIELAISTYPDAIGLTVRSAKLAIPPDAVRLVVPDSAALRLFAPMLRLTTFVARATTWPVASSIAT